MSDPVRLARARRTHLLLEVADSVVVGVGEKMHNGREVLLDVVLKMVHEVASVTLRDETGWPSAFWMRQLPSFSQSLALAHLP